MPKIGNQRPRICKCLKGNEEWGEYAVELASSYGIELFDWQKFAIKKCLTRREDGSLSSLTYCLSIPRQNGKTMVIVVVVMFFLFVLGYRILYTAHHGETAAEVYNRLCDIVETHDDLARVSTIRRSTGRECILAEVDNGDGTVSTSKIQFRTRTKNTGRGLSQVNLLIYDEAQTVTSQQSEDLDALTFATGGASAMTIYAGTPPKISDLGDVFRNLRKSVVEESSSDEVAWLEWSVDEPKPPAEKKWWYETNPSLGLLITERKMEDKVAKTNPDGFNREYLGYWDMNAQGEDHPINSTNWKLCKIDNPSTDTGILYFGIKFSVDGKFAAISVCNKIEHEEVLPHIECLGYQSTNNGVNWILDYISPNLDKTACIMLDGNVSNDAMVDKLNDLGAVRNQVIVCRTKDVTSACQTLVNDVKEHNFTHYGQALLTDSAINCVKRPVGRLGAWAFEDFLGGSATVIESAAIALYASKKSKRNPYRRGKIY